ncbi:hypothetical protein SAMN04488072_1035 [Lentibacillus halodurans]|uniref:Uncharacterized protein n=1 Tax=Lentibacillus halodurans TaxID=237679 RepID=A0A1I0WHQ6_9BACI|nr:hypothetical protein [Lentibacillus halodurans]SFA87476.1 hypothetical protein SAMN04488072_1035 [Lentibacillus halodurans]
MWKAYKSIDSFNGNFSSWAKTNIQIEMASDVLQNDDRMQQYELLSNMLQSDIPSNAHSGLNHLDRIQEKLTVNQWKWLYNYIILHQSAGEEE